MGGLHVADVSLSVYNTIGNWSVLALELADRSEISFCFDDLDTWTVLRISFSVLEPLFFECLFY